jgi:LysR family transcriptional regulator, benzoate and cis,cis-muconate-responsive activator of ben and cat genes
VVFPLVGGATIRAEMELRQLRYFVTVAEELHFSRAAARLYLTAPSLSQQIKVLERHVGTPLFERDRRRVVLTEAGRLLLQHAKELLADADRAMAEMRAYSAGLTGNLRIGLLVGNAGGLTLPILESFRNTHPHVELSFVTLDFAGQLNGPLGNRVDVAFVRPPLDEERLDVLTLAVEPRVAVVPARSELADADELTLADVVDRPFIDRHGLAMPASWIDFWLLTEERGGADAHCQESHRPMDSYDAVLLDIALHKTMTIVPACVGRATTDPAVKTVPVRGLECEIAVCSRRNDTSPLVRDFREIAAHTARELIHTVPGGRLPRG